MKLITILTYPFKDWMMPVRFTVIAFPLFLLSMFAGSALLQLIGATLFFIAFLWLVASMLFLLIKKEWSRCLYTLLFIVTLVVVFGLLS